jgi:hypothetical protein
MPRRRVWLSREIDHGLACRRWESPPPTPEKDVAGSAEGRRAIQGATWSFRVAVENRVSAVDQADPRRSCHAPLRRGAMEFSDVVVSNAHDAFHHRWEPLGSDKDSSRTLNESQRPPTTRRPRTAAGARRQLTLTGIGCRMVSCPWPRSCLGGSFNPVLPRSVEAIRVRLLLRAHQRLCPLRSGRW